LADFNNFFEPESNPGITAVTKYQLEIAKAKGTDKVLITRMVANEPVGTLPLFLFTLLVIGHEIEHCVNHHNRHQDSDARDSKALEQWADFLGVRVAFTLLSFGPFTTDAAASYGEVIIPYASPGTIAKDTKTLPPGASNRQHKRRWMFNVPTLQIAIHQLNPPLAIGQSIAKDERSLVGRICH
jgi:hypothetical protein